MSAVDALLEKHRVTNVSKVCKCLKAGILWGHVKLLPPEEDPENKFNLDQVGIINFIKGRQGRYDLCYSALHC